VSSSKLVIHAILLSLPPINSIGVIDFTSGRKGAQWVTTKSFSPKYFGGGTKRLESDYACGTRLLTRSDCLLTCKIATINRKHYLILTYSFG